MGAGDRIKVGVFPGLAVSIAFERFPYTVTVTMGLLCFWVSIGFGKAYTDK